jgi:phenol 2-monooxygenase
MNTGIHDATNLGWKLAGILKGLYSDAILDTYDTERRASAEHLIQLDRDISALISGTIPSHFNAPPDANFNDYLELVYSNNASFTVGLGISYEGNLINKVPPPDHMPLASAKVGHRALDAPVYRPGAAFPKPLRSLTPYAGRFWILVFAGRVEQTSDAVQLNPECSARYRALRGYLDSTDSFTRALAPAFEFLTILHGEGSLQPAETMGAQPLGKTVYDHSGEAYVKYGVDGASGAIVVLRPDGIVCFSSSLDAYDELAGYFASFVKHLPGIEEKKVITQTVGGEISIEGQEESTQLSTQQ